VHGDSKGNEGRCYKLWKNFSGVCHPSTYTIPRLFCYTIAAPQCAA